MKNRAVPSPAPPQRPPTFKMKCIARNKSNSRCGNNVVSPFALCKSHKKDLGKYQQGAQVDDLIEADLIHPDARSDAINFEYEGERWFSSSKDSAAESESDGEGSSSPAASQTAPFDPPTSTAGDKRRPEDPKMLEQDICLLVKRLRTEKLLSPENLANLLNDAEALMVRLRTASAALKKTNSPAKKRLEASLEDMKSLAREVAECYQRLESDKEVLSRIEALEGDVSSVHKEVLELAALYGFECLFIKED